MNYLLSLPYIFFSLSTLLLEILSSSGFLIWSCFHVEELFCFAPLVGQLVGWEIFVLDFVVVVFYGCLFLDRISFCTAD